MASDRTLAAYAEDWRAFVAWRGYDAGAPPTVAELGQWALAQAEHGAAWASIKRRLYGVGKRLEVGSISELADIMERVRRMIRGRRVQKAKPIRADDLSRALKRLPDDARGSRTRALFLVMWNGALRVSEAQGMEWQHLTWSVEGIALYLPVSKTDQYGDGATVAIPRHPVERLDPARALEHWRNIAPNGEAVWQHIGKRQVPDGRPVVGLRNLIDAELRKLGFGPGYSSHSFRAGWITEAASAGCTESEMMMQTRHRSPAVLQGYIREVRLWDDNPAAKVSRRLG